MTSNCDVTNNAHQMQMTTIWPSTKNPPWKVSAYATEPGRAGNFCCCLPGALADLHGVLFVAPTLARLQLLVLHILLLRVLFVAKVVSSEKPICAKQTKCHVNYTSYCTFGCRFSNEHVYDSAEKVHL